jgi:hypothetical protein
MPGLIFTGGQLCPQKLYLRNFFIIITRQPDSCDRPTFPQLVELLSRADFELFAWEEEDLRDSDRLQVKTIGAPLETAKNLYPHLQTLYINRD